MSDSDLDLNFPSALSERGRERREDILRRVRAEVPRAARRRRVRRVLVVFVVAGGLLGAIHLARRDVVEPSRDGLATRVQSPAGIPVVRGREGLTERLAVRSTSPRIVRVPRVDEPRIPRIDDAELSHLLVVARRSPGVIRVGPRVILEDDLLAMRTTVAPATP